MKWVSFQEVKERVSIRQVLEYYKIDALKEQDGKLVGPCPVHGGDSPTAFHVDLERSIWHCFTKCRGGGNVLDLVARKESITIRDAALKLQALFLVPSPERPASVQPPPGNPGREPSGGDAVEIDPKPSDSNDSASANSPLPFTLNLAPDHPYLERERSLASDTIRHFGLGYCLQGTMRGRIAIPIHDASGQLVAYAGRVIKDDKLSAVRPKYKFPKGFKKQLVLYNLHRAKEGLGQSGHLIIVEGFFDVFRLHQAGYENAVALMGSAMSIEQEALVRDSCSKVTLFLDGDDAGRACVEECLWRLVHDLHCRLIDLEDGEEPDSLTPERIKELLG